MTEQTPAPPMVPAPPTAPKPPDRAGERWGWELHTPDGPVPEPFGEDPPAPAVVGAGWSRRLAARRARVFDGWYGHVRRLATLVLAVGAAGFATTLEGEYAGLILGGLAAVTVVTAFIAIRPIALPWWGDVRYRRWRKGVLDRQREVLERTRGWSRRREEHEQRLDQQSIPERWEPLRPMTTHRVDVFGGDPPGCEALLLSVAGSILRSGAPVTVADLSQDGICRALVKQAIGERRSVFAGIMPQDLPVLGLLEGLSAEDIADAVAETVHVDERDRSAGADRTLDANLIEQVCGCLNGRITFGRLEAALRVVAEPDDRPESIDRDEYDRLTELLGEGQRRGVEGRLYRLSAALQKLAGLEKSDVHVQAASGADSAQLVVWDLSDRLSQVVGGLLAQMSFQVLLQRLRADRLETGRVLIVIGADRFRREHLERMDQLARRRGVRLVFLFRHLRDDAVELLGGGEAVMFLRMGNAKEAENAATFIGRDHRLVLSNFTVQHSSNLSTTVGTSTSDSTSDQESETKGRQWSRSHNYQYGSSTWFPHDQKSVSKGKQDSVTTGRSWSTTTGTSESEQVGTSESESKGYQRVYEFVVEPRFLQGLAPTSFILVDPRDPGSPRIGDASPELEAMRSLQPPGQVDPRVAAAMNEAVAGSGPGPGPGADLGVGQGAGHGAAQGGQGGQPTPAIGQGAKPAPVPGAMPGPPQSEPAQPAPGQPATGPRPRIAAPGTHRPPAPY